MIPYFIILDISYYYFFKSKSIYFTIIDFFLYSIFRIIFILTICIMHVLCFTIKRIDYLFISIFMTF